MHSFLLQWFNIEFIQKHICTENIQLIYKCGAKYDVTNTEIIKSRIITGEKQHARFFRIKPRSKADPDDLVTTRISVAFNYLVIIRSFNVASFDYLRIAKIITLTKIFIILTEASVLDGCLYLIAFFFCFLSFIYAPGILLCYTF